MQFWKDENDTEDIEYLSFVDFLDWKGYEKYEKDFYILVRSFGNYYYSYCRKNGYLAEDLSKSGCKAPKWVNLLC